MTAPSSQILVGPASVASAKLICNENNRIRVTLHTSSRKCDEPALGDHPSPPSSCRLLGLLLQLQRPHLGVSPVLRQQLPMGTSLQDMTLIQNNNLVRIHHRRKAVGDD